MEKVAKNRRKITMKIYRKHCRKQKKNDNINLSNQLIANNKKVIKKLTKQVIANNKKVIKN